MAKLKPPPAIANTEAMKTAEQAAAAVGLSVQDLCDLLVDNGITALPTSDGITEKYTLEDLGSRLWGAMQREKKSDRATWFAKLSDPQKTAIIVTLRSRGFSTLAVATDFDLAERAVRETYNAYASELGAQVVGIRLDTMVGQMQLACERAMQMASEAGDHSALWRIQKELVATLQSVGIVDRAAHRIDVKHGLDDEAKSELDALAALENKKLLRLEHVAQHEQEIEDGDNLPDNLNHEDQE